MPISPARIAAFDILLRIEREDAFSSELLHSGRYKDLSRADHALTTELVMGVLRWRSWLDKGIAASSSQPLHKLDLEVLTSLRLAAYQISSLDRVPHRAAVHDSVELVKRARKTSAAPFVNAVLRKLSRNPTKRDLLDHIRSASAAAELADASAHPLWLIERWIAQYGLDITRRVCEYNQHVPETAIRLTDAGVENELKSEGIELASGRLLASARRVLSSDITSTRAFRRGAVAIQDEASQLVAFLAGYGSHILDCCAAPGGKTRVLAERNPAASITAVESHSHRARLLKKLVPAANVEVITADIRELRSEPRFDCVLADVPCCGTGTLARNPEIKWRLSPSDLPDLQQRQLAILQSAMKLVRPGGRLVYSTCSLEHDENSDVIEQVLSSNPSFRLLDCKSELERLRRQGELVWQNLGSLTSNKFLRTLPGLQPCDGFFACFAECIA